jgi:PAS domain S-box-containing protein
MSKPAPRRPELPGDAPYREIFQAAGIPCLLFDPASGVITEANPAACRLLGGNRQALLGLTLGGLVAPSDGAGMALALGELGGTGAAAPLERNFTLITLDGQSLPLRCQLGSVPSSTRTGSLRLRLSAVAPGPQGGGTGAHRRGIRDGGGGPVRHRRRLPHRSPSIPPSPKSPAIDREEVRASSCPCSARSTTPRSSSTACAETLAEEGRWQGEIWNRARTARSSPNGCRWPRCATRAAASSATWGPSATSPGARRRRR